MTTVSREGSPGAQAESHATGNERDTRKPPPSALSPRAAAPIASARSRTSASPIPAPPVLSGVMGVVGVWAGAMATVWVQAQLASGA